MTRGTAPPPRATATRGYRKASYSFEAEQVRRMDEIASDIKSDRATVARQLLELGLKAYARRERIAAAMEEDPD